MPNIFTSNQLNALFSGGKPTEANMNPNQTVSKIDGAASKQAIAELKNMLIGDIFTGEVMGSEDGALLIKMGSSNILKANIAQGNANLSKGELVTFQVENKSDDKVFLKSLTNETESLAFANKALEAAKLAITRENLSLVKNLVDMNMPIDKNTLNELSFTMSRFPDADINTLVRLYKLDIPVTAENIMEFEAYKSFENNIMGTVSNLITDLGDIFNEMTNTLQGDNIANLLTLNEDIVNLLSQNEGISYEKLMSMLSEKGVSLELTNILEQLSKAGQVSDKNISQGLQPGNMTSENIDKMISIIKENVTGAGAQLKSLQNLMNKTNLPDSVIAKIINSDNYKELLKDSIHEKFFIKPGDVADKEEVKKVYEKMLDFAQNGKAALEKAGLGDSSAARGMNSIKNSVEFMNELNHNMSFIQVPIKFSNQEKNGNLYVYSNKKGSTKENDVVTALLHLDMDNLGPMDVYVKMKNMSVSTNFCLESEEMLDFIYENIDILTKRLNDKGYDFNPTMTLKENSNNVDFIKDFVDVEQPVIPVSRYLFDSKA